MFLKHMIDNVADDHVRGDSGWSPQPQHLYRIVYIELKLSQLDLNWFQIYDDCDKSVCACLVVNALKMVIVMLFQKR